MCSRIWRTGLLPGSASPEKWCLVLAAARRFHGVDDGEHLQQRFGGAAGLGYDMEPRGPQVDPFEKPAKGLAVEIINQVQPRGCLDGGRSHGPPEGELRNRLCPQARTTRAEDDDVGRVLLQMLDDGLGWLEIIAALERPAESAYARILRRKPFFQGRVGRVPAGLERRAQRWQLKGLFQVLVKSLWVHARFLPQSLACRQCLCVQNQSNQPPELSFSAACFSLSVGSDALALPRSITGAVGRGGLVARRLASSLASSGVAA